MGERKEKGWEKERAGREGRKEKEGLKPFPLQFQNPVAATVCNPSNSCVSIASSGSHVALTQHLLNERKFYRQQLLVLADFVACVGCVACIALLALRWKPAFSGRPMAQPPSLNLKKNYTIGTPLLDTKWAYGNDHAHHVHFRMLTGHQSMGGTSARLQHASLASSLSYQGLYEYTPRWRGN